MTPNGVFYVVRIRLGRQGLEFLPSLDLTLCTAVGALDDTVITVDHQVFLLERINRTRRERFHTGHFGKFRQGVGFVRENFQEEGLSVVRFPVVHLFVSFPYIIIIF